MPENSLETTNVPGDLVNLVDERIAVEGYHLKAPVAMDEVEILGQPVKIDGENMIFVQDTDEANAVGMVFAKDKLTLAVNGVSQKKYAVIVRGPAVLNKTNLPASDVNGDAFTIATLVTAYKGLGDIAVKDETGISETQTT